MSISDFQKVSVRKQRVQQLPIEQLFRFGSFLEKKKKKEEKARMSSRTRTQCSWGCGTCWRVTACKAHVPQWQTDNTLALILFAHSYNDLWANNNHTQKAIIYLFLCVKAWWYNLECVQCLSSFSKRHIQRFELRFWHKCGCENEQRGCETTCHH